MSGQLDVIELIRVSNPFEYRGPLSRSELFFDRVQELQDALVACGQIVRGATGGVLTIGGRGSGKTSFLDALKRELVKRKIPNAKISLDEGMVKEGNENLFFKLILTDLVKASQLAGLLEEGLTQKILELLRGLGNIEEIGVDLFGFKLIAKATKEQLEKELPYTVLRDGLKDFLKLISEKGHGKALQGAILLLDEGDALTLNRNLLQILRNVFQETPKVGLVLAGSTKLLSQVSDVFSPIPRFFRKIELGPYPADSVVYDAIRRPLELSKQDLVKQGVNLETVHGTFDRIVTQISGRMPMEVNMLCHFALDLGAKRIKREPNSFVLYMRVDGEVLDEAMKQMGGTKEYGSFIAELENNEKSLLTILSKSFDKATVEEITILIALQEMGDALQESPVEKVAETIEKAEKYRDNILKLLLSITSKSQKYRLNVLSSTLTGKPRFEVEDQWVRAYFKYNRLELDVDLELGLKPRFGGIRVFGDPIATVIHSTFFPRLADRLGSRTPFRAHVGADRGQWLTAAYGHKILNVNYLRSATNSMYHIAFQVKQGADIGGIENAIEILMETLSAAGIVGTYDISEKKAPSYSR